MNPFGVVGPENIFEHAPSEATARKWAMYQYPVGGVVRSNPAQPAVKMPDGTAVLL